MGRPKRPALMFMLGGLDGSKNVVGNGRGKGSGSREAAMAVDGACIGLAAKQQADARSCKGNADKDI